MVSPKAVIPSRGVLFKPVVLRLFLLIRDPFGLLPLLPGYTASWGVGRPDRYRILSCLLASIFLGTTRLSMGVRRAPCCPTSGSSVALVIVPCAKSLLLSPPWGNTVKLGRTPSTVLSHNLFPIRCDAFWSCLVWFPLGTSGFSAGPMWLPSPISFSSVSLAVNCLHPRIMRCHFCSSIGAVLVPC